MLSFPISSVCLHPAASAVGLGNAPIYNGPSAVNEQHAQVWITALRDTEQALFVSAGMLTWNQPQPGPQLPPIAKCFAVGDGGYDCGCNHRPHSLYLCNLLASFFSMEDLLDPPFHGGDPFVDTAKAPHTKRQTAPAQKALTEDAVHL
jgi:hypothetical protein